MHIYDKDLVPPTIVCFYNLNQGHQENWSENNALLEIKTRGTSSLHLKICSKP